VNDDIHLDYPTSTVTIAGRPFPACMLVCPDDDEYPEPNPVQRTLGGQGDGKFGPWTDVFIPTESGLLVDLQWTPERLDCRLSARTCHRDGQPDGDGWVEMWLPHRLRIVNGHVREGSQDWTRCESWWLLEHIDRVAALPYREPPGPKCDLVRLAKVDFTRTAS
jgi:hypothetical protein